MKNKKKLLQTEGRNLFFTIMFLKQVKSLHFLKYDYYKLFILNSTKH